MQFLTAIGIILLSYILGSIPFGLLIVRLTTGKDIRKVESGRTGGTNAMRAAGFWAGLATTILDVLKAAFSSWMAQYALPGMPLAHVLAPVAAVLGHNYSIFLIERTPEGKIRLRGGAGGAPAAGGAIGLWAPSVAFTVPIGGLILLTLGYASVATMSVPLVATLVFAYRAWIGASPWEYILYGPITEIILVIALLPNIRRLIQGTERMVGPRARRRQQNAHR